MEKAVGFISSNKRNEIEHAVELKVQRERIEEFCNNNGYELVEFYVASASDEYNIKIFRLIEDAQADKFKHVIVHAMERLVNDKIEKDWLLNEFNKYNLHLHSVTEKIIFAFEDNADELKNKAVSLKSKVKEIPSLPEVVNKVISLIQNPHSSASQLAEVISNDAGLTAKVLKFVNSAYYGFPKQISSIQHAIAILGFSTIRGLVLSSSIFRIFSPSENDSGFDSYKKLWEHSLQCAIATKHLNKILKVSSDDNLFSASILHDMGKIVLEQYDHNNYVMALSAGNKSYDNLQNEKKYCGLNHCEVGYLIADGWNLPELISETIRYHHKPSDAKAQYKSVVAVVSLANTFSNMFSNGIDFFDICIDNIDLNILNLDMERLKDLFYFVKEEIESENNSDFM